jgi:Tol biopolymer transport system component
MKATFFALIQSALLPAAMLLAFAAAPACGQTRAAIYVMKVDGGEVRKVSHNDERWLGSPAWSHDAKRLLYDAAPPNRNYRQCRIMLETLSPAEGPPAEAGNKVEDLDSVDLGHGCGPQWSPDDKQLAFYLGAQHEGGQRPGVYVMNVDGEGREWICEGLRPRWSPDGEKLVVASEHEGFWSLYIYDIFEASLTRVLQRGYDHLIGGCWSPDGKRLAFVGYKGGTAFGGGRGELALVDAAADQAPQAIIEDRVGWQPDWSPDGKRILAWISSGGQERLHLFDPEGLEPRVELPGQAGSHNSDAVFSPDGKWIAWGSSRGG